MSAVARRHGLTPQQLFGWRRDARQQREAGTCDGTSAFAPVLVEAASSSADAAIAPACRQPVNGDRDRDRRCDRSDRAGELMRATLQTVLRALLAAT